MACNMNNSGNQQSRDPNCYGTPSTTESSLSDQGPLSRDFPCDDRTDMSETSHSRHTYGADPGTGDIGSQTHKDSGMGTNNPHSYDQAGRDHRDRNPITGCGLNGDGVGGLKPKKPKNRGDGNPVTGEGYKPVEFNQNPTMNGANQVINKNRIPPGGYSSGLW